MAITLQDLKSKEQEYRAALRARITKLQADYLKRGETAVAKKSTPSHHAHRWAGSTPTAYAHWAWSEAIWCQDITIEWPVEFFTGVYGVDASAELDTLFAGDDSAEDAVVWANNIFDDEFRALAPDLNLPVDVLEA